MEGAAWRWLPSFGNYCTWSWLCFSHFPVYPLTSFTNYKFGIFIHLFFIIYWLWLPCTVLTEMFLCSSYCTELVDSSENTNGLNLTHQSTTSSHVFLHIISSYAAHFWIANRKQHILSLKRIKEELNLSCEYDLHLECVEYLYFEDIFSMPLVVYLHEQICLFNNLRGCSAWNNLPY